MKNNNIIFWGKGFFIFIFLLIFQYASSQCRGAFCFGNPPSSFALMNGLTGKTASGGGGIMFEKAAILSEGLQINNLELSYNQSNIDGERMVLKMNENTVYFKLYDWQLIPIAKYSNSEFTLCFTYFGELTDKNLESVVLNNNGHILNYHPEFSNTLIGWRLADMDLMVMYNFTSDLPKVNNSYVLGSGEMLPNVNSNTLGSNNFINQLISIENDLGYTFRSYIITDHYSDTEINITNDSLKLNGNPYYYCWRLREDSQSFNIQDAGDSIATYYQNLVNQKLLENANFSERNLYIDSLISLSNRYPTSYPLYESGTFIDLVGLDSYDSKKTFLENYYTESLRDFLIAVSTDMFATEIDYLKEYSDRMSASPEIISSCNPAIWEATVNTMQVSALFRYIKLNFPDQWQLFLDQVSGINPQPEVTTPTVLYDAGNTVIEDAIKNSPSVSIKNTKNENEIVLYPNPVNNLLNIQNLTSENIIQILSMDGKIIMIENVNSTSVQISLEHIPNGIYNVNILEGDKTIHFQKIVKE